MACLKNTVKKGTLAKALDSLSLTVLILLSLPQNHAQIFRNAENRIQLPGDSTTFRRLFGRLDSLVRFGRGQIHIVHIGGSHVQADIYSHRIREKLRNYYPGFEGARGFLFPYTAAGTNNPSNYKVEYGGRWTSCRNVSAQPCLLGLAGISISTRDTNAWIRIIPGRETTGTYSFNRVRLFHPIDSLIPEVTVGEPGLVKRLRVNPILGFTEYYINRNLDTLTFYIGKGDNKGHTFTLFGIQLLNDEPGIIYHSIGVNGAATSSYLRCQLFVPHLKALEPDLVIFSIGVNDAHGPHFSKEKFMDNYRQLIAWVKEAAPGAAILFITNNDTYIRRRYPNENHHAVREAMLELAADNGAGVWDLYTLMGGEGSISAWHARGLAQSDFIHFTREGYTLIGDKLFEAFLKLWKDFSRPPAH